MGNIIIFGGTFDPVHIGHLQIYLSIKKKLQFDKFIIIPTKNPPLKKQHPFASTKDRMAMLKLMFSKYKDVEINQYEVDQKSDDYSYTINTIKHFKKVYPNDKLFLIVGLDRYLDFKKWKDWKSILKLCTLLIINRHKTIKTNLKNCLSIEMPLVNISSSELRTLPNIKFLTRPIAKYIADNGLYISEQIKPLMSDYRLKHTLRVCDLAMELGNTIDKKLLKKIYIASMYHDVCKEFNDSHIKKHTNKKHTNIHVLHGHAGANYIKKHFNIDNREILDAVANHVIPNKNPSSLSKIIYCADKLEPNRTIKDIENRLEMIALVKKDINKGFKLLFQQTQSKFTN